MNSVYDSPDWIAFVEAIRRRKVGRLGAKAS